MVVELKSSYLIRDFLLFHPVVKGWRAKSLCCSWLGIHLTSLLGNNTIRVSVLNLHIRVKILEIKPFLRLWSQQCFVGKPELSIHSYISTILEFILSNLSNLQLVKLNHEMFNSRLGITKLLRVLSTTKHVSSQL